ncbi:HlyD family secretion protein [Desulfovibrio gilichinskyi]|uniref:HlyD family secretion protein n=1 Tax=Desulfovibrio gilichinskyi TaxID=1519643 RepID=A0A1X7C1L7_9BACT|nr:HlyD family efflux transporter periplasmic adaptor subunit [Desulfovibrio gilichinskyi]SME88393.1 HlyD family secretion protein [Desulfovibrio gilichinskyi]
MKKTETRVLLLIFTITICLLLSACTDDENFLWQGYVEGDFVYVSSPLGGQLEEVNVKKGQQVTANQTLFTLERKYEKAGVDEASENLDKSLSDLANKRKGSRPSEIASIKARLKKAKAAESLAATDYKRRADLYRSRTISEEERDTSLSTYQQATQQVNQITSELVTATLGSRSDEINAAESAVDAAKARLVQARWNYDQKEQTAPRSGLVFDTIRYKGEWVPAGNPVLSILPPENRKVKFYVPEPIVGEFRIGEELFLNYDGLNEPVKIKLTYISPKSEYTPPVIYSSQSRAKLVFMLEAYPELKDALCLKPGQPVDVSRNIKYFDHKVGIIDTVKSFFRGRNG